MNDTAPLTGDLDVDRATIKEITMPTYLVTRPFRAEKLQKGYQVGVTADGESTVHTVTHSQMTGRVDRRGQRLIGLDGADPQLVPLDQKFQVVVQDATVIEMPRPIEGEYAQFLTDVLTTAAEGGVNAWGQVSGYDWENPDPSLRGFDLADWCDGEHQGDYRVTLRILDRGVRAIARGGEELMLHPTNANNVTRAVAILDAGDIDAEAADWVVQAGLWGEVRYG